jgi:MFS family permease
MNVDIGFSESQYGILASVAFTSLFAIASLVAGFAADRFNRKTLTIASASVWGLATLGTSLSNSYFEVVLWRVLMGLSCAFSTPTAYTLLAQRVPADKKATASSLFSTGVALGGGLASLSILLDNQIGWRNTSLVIGLFAFASAAINFAVLEDDPKQLLTAEAVSSSPGASNNNASAVLSEVAQVLSTSRVKLLLLASFLRFCSGLLIGVWSAPYFRLLFPSNAGEYAVAQAFITSTCGIVSGLIGGAAADRLVGTDKSESAVGRQLWVPVVGNILAAPAWYFAITSQASFQYSMTWLAVEYLVAECWFGPTVNVLQSTVGPKIGGTAQGMFTVTGAVGNLAPALLGFLYDQANGSNTDHLTTLLAVGVCGCYLSSAFCFGASALALTPTDKEKET